MAEKQREAAGGTPAPTTPGRPKDASSRQQKHEDQALQSGHAELDRKSGQSGTSEIPTKPPGPK